MPPRHRSSTVRRAVAVLCALAPPLTVAATAAAVPPRPSSGPARVTRSTTTDPRDTRGPLDIAAVLDRVVVRKRAGVRVSYSVRTYHRFRTVDLNRRHRNFTIELGTDGERGASRNITVYARGDRLRADLISNATRNRIARLTVRRTGPRSLWVGGPRRLTGARRYFVVSRYENLVTAPCGTSGGVVITCGDEVPRNGWLRLDRPAWPRASASAAVGVRAS